MDIKVGDIVIYSDDDCDFEESPRYLVKKIKSEKVKIMIISPEEYILRVEISELKKTGETLDEARERWRKRYGYSGI